MRRLCASLQLHRGDCDESLDSDAASDVTLSSDMSGINPEQYHSLLDPEQYHSLLELISSLLSDVKLETDSESEGGRLVDSGTTVVLDNCVSFLADGNPNEQAKRDDCQSPATEALTETSRDDCKPIITAFPGNCQPPNKTFTEKDDDSICRMVTEDNIDKSNSESKLHKTAVKSSDRCGKALGVVKNDVNSWAVEHSTDFSSKNTNSNVEECVSDDDDDDKLIIESCDKKAVRENVHDGSSTREFSEDNKSVKAVMASEPSDNVLWKEGDIEVRLEVGEDESSNSPVYADDADKTSDHCPEDDKSDVPASKLPRTSIRISLSKLTALISGEDVAEEPSTNRATRVKRSVASREQVKSFHPQKPKLQKNRMKLRRPRDESAKITKLSKTKCDVTAKPKDSQDTSSIDNQPQKRPRGRPRKNSLQSAEPVFNTAMNGICTRRRCSSSGGKRVCNDAVTESNVKSACRDTTANKSKKRRASRGVEYIDDDATSSQHHDGDNSTYVTVKKNANSNSRSEEHDGILRSCAVVDTNSQPVSDKENEKCTTVNDVSSLNPRRQTAGKKRRKSCSATCNRSDVSRPVDSSVAESVTANSTEDACADDDVSVKRSRTVSSGIEENEPSSDNEDSLKTRCTTEEMFRQIGRDGLECCFCRRELRTRTQLLQHAKLQCHLQCKSSSVSDAECAAVDAKKRHSSETEVCTLKSENQNQIATGSAEVGSDEDKKPNVIQVDAINGVTVKNRIIEISPLTEKTDDKKAETETDTKETDRQSDDTSEKADDTPDKADAAVGDALADCVCDGCGEVVPDCSWLTAHIVTCPGRSGAADEMSTESFHTDAPEWSSERDSVLVPESGLEPVAEDAGSQPVEVDAASLLQLLCTVENSLLCSVASENDAGCQPITVVSDSLLQESGNTAVTEADSNREVGRFGREIVHDGVAMYEFAEYQCSLCPVTFLDRAAAIRHATGTKVHAACTVERASIYCCMQCDMRYRDQQLMWYHVTYICQQSEAAAVPASEVHRCSWCSKQFLTTEYLSRHCHIQHSTELSSVDSQMTLRELAVATSQQSTIGNTDVAGSETQKQVLQALARATMRSGTNSTPRSRKEAALLRSKLVIASDTLPARRTAKGIVYKNVFMQCIVSYICSNCGRDLSTKLAKREHRAAAPDSCFDSGPGGRRLFTYVRHYSYLCPYCNERSATQKACRAHQLATCLPRMGVKTDELNHKQLLCPFCQRKYFNVITLKGHMTLVHQISRAESNQLLAGVSGASEEVGAIMAHDTDRTTVNTASLSDSRAHLQLAAARSLNNAASVDSFVDDDEDENSAAEDDDSNSIKSETASRDSRFETVDPSLPLLSSSNKTSSSILRQNNKHRGSCTSSDNSSENDNDDDVDSGDDKSDDDDNSVHSSVSMQRRFTAGRKPQPVLKKSSGRKS